MTQPRSVKTFANYDCNSTTSGAEYTPNTCPGGLYSGPFDYPLFEPFSSPRRPVLAMVVIAKDFLDSGFRRNDGWGSAIIV